MKGKIPWTHTHNSSSSICLPACVCVWLHLSLCSVCVCTQLCGYEVAGQATVYSPVGKVASHGVHHHLRICCSRPGWVDHLETLETLVSVCTLSSHMSHDCRWSLVQSELKLRGQKRFYDWFFFFFSLGEISTCTCNFCNQLKTLRTSFSSLLFSSTYNGMMIQLELIL